MSHPNFEIRRVYEYKNGFNPNENIIPKKLASGCDRKAVGQGWGTALVVIGSLGILAGAGLIVAGVLKFKAIPIFTDTLSIGVGAGVVVVGGVGLGSGIYLIKKSYWKDPAYAAQVWEKIRTKNCDFATIMDFPIAEIRGRHIVSEKFAAAKFVDYIRSQQLTFADVMTRFTRANNPWRTPILGEQGFISYQVLEGFLIEEIERTCKTDGEINPQLIEANYSVYLIYDRGIISKEKYKAEYSKSAENATYAEMKKLDIGVLPKAERTRILNKQYQDLRCNFVAFKQKHGEGVWEMIRDGVLTARAFRDGGQGVVTYAAAKNISEVAMQLGPQVFYLEPSPDNREVDTLRILHGTVGGIDWSNHMDQEILGAGTFSALVANFGGDVQQENWGHLDTILKANLGDKANYVAILHEEMKTMSYPEIVRKFGSFDSKIFKAGFLSKDDLVLRQKFLAWCQTQEYVKKARESYPLSWQQLLTQQEKAGLILHEIEAYKVNYDAFTVRFGFDIFEVVEPKAPAVRECFEQYIRNHGFCKAWETYCLDPRTRYRASGDSHLSDQWLGEINKPNGVSAALRQARTTHQSSLDSAQAAYQAEINQAARARSAVVDPLTRRVGELEAEISRKTAAHQQAQRDFAAAEAELTKQQNAELERARLTAFATSVQISDNIRRIEGKIRDQQARIDAHRRRIAGLQHPVHGVQIHHAPVYVAEGRGIVKIGKRVDIHSAAYQTFSVGDLNAEAMRLGQRITAHTHTLVARREALRAAEGAAQLAYVSACAGINARFAPLHQRNAAARSQAEAAYTSDLGYLKGQLGAAQEILKQKTAEEDAKYEKQVAASEASKNAKISEAGRVLAIAKTEIDADFRKWWSVHSPGTIVGGSVNPLPFYPAPPPVVLPLHPGYNPAFQGIPVPQGGQQ